MYKIREELTTTQNDQIRIATKTEHKQILKLNYNNISRLTDYAEN